MKYRFQILIAFSFLCSDLLIAQESSIPPMNIRLFEMAQMPGAYSWKDLDNWYKGELPQYQDKEYYRNLQAVFFYHLIETFNMDEEADSLTVEFYVQKQVEFGWQPDPELFVRCLQRLERGGDSQSVLLYATTKYDKDIKELEKKPALWMIQDKYEVLKKYINHLYETYPTLKHE